MALPLPRNAPSEPTTIRCGCADLRRAARAATQLYDLVLAPTGLKSTQFITLQAIAEAGEIAQWRLSELYSIAVETLSRRLGAMRKQGLVEVRRGDHHGERLYRLSAAGVAKLRHARPYWERAQERLREELGNDDWEALHRLCRNVVLAARRAASARKPNAQPRREGAKLSA